ncbi:hypothetical protein PLESTB_000453500 [Pleodorina starrii]|uniref:Uncharacterized protein n=1 Tax=Pleodorina starrii TaxID=330485 RepID=A0A9W6EZU3_9CHLO|nr:hypothetical protein PLESTM_000754900 [Pleodorina starrii]GLC50984.1 hypothetical protein PLESTB_000453500 [Pleodorina starrii]
MNWSLGNHPTARIGIKQSLSHAYQVWCPHVAQAPRVCAKQAQATGLAAPSYAPGVSLAELQADAAASHPTDASSDGAGTVLPRHAGTWTPDHGDLGIIATCAGGAGASPSPSPASSGPCRGHTPPPQHASPIASDISILTHATHHTRPPADRTAEASTSSSSASAAGLSQNYSSCSSSRNSSSSRRSCWSSAVGSRTAAAGSGDSGGKNDSRSRTPAAARPSRRSNNHASRPGASGGGGGSGGSPASSADAPAEDDPAAAAAAAAGGPQPPRQPLTLERLRDQNPDLRALDLELLRQRLGVLCGILQLDQTAALQLCRVVPGLLLTESSSLQRSWRRLAVSLGGEEPARGAAAAAPLLLVLPSDRVPLCVASLAAATALSRSAAAALVAEWPQLATHAPPSFAAKLQGLRRLLAAEPAEPAPPAALRAALRAAPRLLTFSTSALQRHHDELSALLGSQERLRAALAREPGLLAQRPATVAAKLALLRQLMDCDAAPGAVAALVVRAPGLLRRSLAALAAGCRALSIWQFRRRDKLRMVLSRPGLLALPAVEVHGRCRWLRRLMLSNAYYHAALRRLPPSLVGAVVAALPQAWARLQYLAESSQECRMGVLDVVECRQDEFAARFPEFDRWLQFKIKLMGAENPWRGTLRIRGFNSVAARDRAAPGSPNQVNLLQRQQRQRVARRPYQRQQQQQHTGPSMSVVLAEAGEVRSGGSTVSRPRRVLRQPLTVAHPPPPPPPPALSPPLAEGPSGPPAVFISPTVGVEVAAAPPLPPPPPGGARKRFPATGRKVAASGAAMPAAAAAAAAAAELPR